MNKEVSIIGSGLVGSLWACYMGKRGYKVNVYEQRLDRRLHKMNGGRSINLAISHRGLRALREVGLEQQALDMAIPMRGRLIHHANGSTDFQHYGQEGQAINSISRGGLNTLLIDTAEQKYGAELHFGRHCSHASVQKNVFEFTDEKGKKIPDPISPDLLFGTDGAFSSVRRSKEHTDRFNYQQYYLEHGYKELVIPSDDQGNHRIEKNALHIWPRKRFMLIALPNLDGSFTCTLFLPFTGPDSFAYLDSPMAVSAFFSIHFSDALALMPTLEKDFATNPTSSLVTVRCYPWVYDQKIALLGDAAHAIVPFYGQGMNAGFEDCRILNNCIDEQGEDWPRVLEHFQKNRKKDADAIADFALQNFIEMRDRVADKQFLLRKKIERKLHQRFPDRFIPVYSMVTFTDIAYSKAWAMKHKQEAFFKKVLEIDNIEAIWEEESTLNTIKQLMDTMEI